MNVSILIARCTASDKGSSQNVIVRIATAAVAVSLAVMILSLAVVFGFREQMNTLIGSAVGEVVVTDLRTLESGEAIALHNSEALRERILATSGVRAVEPYIVRGAIIRSSSNMSGAIVRGVSPQSDMTAYERMTVEGRTPRLDGARFKEVMISQRAARQLGVGVDGRVELLFKRENDELQRELFKVCGIHSLSLDEGRSDVAITDIRNLRKINGWGDKLISGYAVRIDNAEAADEVAEALNGSLLNYEGEEHLTAISSRQMHADLFAWLDTHDMNAKVIIIIMLVVALFNMITALLIMVLERTRMIGLLKSMGMRNRQVRHIFLYRAAAIIVRGAVWGNIAAIALALLQQHLHIVQLHSAGYILPEVPISLGAGWIAALNIGFAALILALLACTTTIVARIKPAEAIKYE